MDILIVGAGEMGRWFAEVVGRSDDRIAFTDVDPDIATEAARTVNGRVEPVESNTSFELVCIAVPLSVTETAIEEYAHRVTGAVIDVSGAMAEPVEAMRTHAPSVERISLHPLFSPANAPGNVATVVDESGPIGEVVLERLAAAGNVIVETTPAEHDRAMETVQAATHAAILSYGLATEPVPEGLHTPVSEGLEDLVMTVTGGNPRVYAEIQARFAGADAVAEAATDIANADLEAFERLYREASDR